MTLRLNADWKSGFQQEKPAKFRYKKFKSNPYEKRRLFTRLGYGRQMSRYRYLDHGADLSSYQLLHRIHVDYRFRDVFCQANSCDSIIALGAQRGSIVLLKPTLDFVSDVGGSSSKAGQSVATTDLTTEDAVHSNHMQRQNSVSPGSKSFSRAVVSLESNSILDANFDHTGVLLGATSCEVSWIIDVATCAPMYKLPLSGFNYKIKFSPESSSLFAVTNDQGTVALFDMREKLRNEATKIATGPVSQVPLSGFTRCHDIPKDISRKYVPIDCIDFVNTHIVATASSYGPEVKFWDIRKASSLQSSNSAKRISLPVCTKHPNLKERLHDNAKAIVCDRDRGHKIWVLYGSGILDSFSLSTHSEEIAIDSLVHPHVEDVESILCLINSGPTSSVAFVGNELDIFMYSRQSLGIRKGLVPATKISNAGYIASMAWDSQLDMLVTSVYDDRKHYLQFWGTQGSNICDYNPSHSRPDYLRLGQLPESHVTEYRNDYTFDYSQWKPYDTFYHCAYANIEEFY